MNKSIVVAAIFLIILLYFVQIAQAAAYYISPRGSDTNSGTVNSPFATVGKAHTLVQPGDTIYLRNGVYNITSEITLAKSGTANNLIKLWAYTGERPILDGKMHTIGSPIVMTGANYWYIKGIEIQNASHQGITIENGSGHNILELLNIHNSGWNSDSGMGLAIWDSSNNLILNVDSHHNKNAYDDNGPVGAGNNADGFTVRSSNMPACTGNSDLNCLISQNNIFRGCRSYHNSDDGWDLWSAGKTTIEYSYSWRNGYADDGSPLGDGNGYKMGGGNTGGHSIHNNLSWKNKRAGFDGGVGNANFYNNTSWNNASMSFVLW